MAARIIICEIASADWRRALALEVHPEKGRFVSDFSPVAAMMLANVYVQPGARIWAPFAIMHDQTLVALLDHSYTLQGQPGWLYHFLIDRQYQGRGLGYAAVRACIRFTKENAIMARAESNVRMI